MTVKLEVKVEGVAFTVDIDDMYKDMHSEVVDNENYNGPKEFDRWAAELIKQNKDNLRSIVENSAHQVHQQAKAIENGEVG